MAKHPYSITVAHMPGAQTPLQPLTFEEAASTLEPGYVIAPCLWDPKKSIYFKVEDICEHKPFDYEASHTADMNIVEGLNPINMRPDLKDEFYQEHKAEIDRVCKLAYERYHAAFPEYPADIFHRMMVDPPKYFMPTQIYGYSKVNQNDPDVQRIMPLCEAAADSLTTNEEFDAFIDSFTTDKDKRIALCILLLELEEAPQMSVFWTETAFTPSASSTYFQPEDLQLYFEDDFTSDTFGFEFTANSEANSYTLDAGDDYSTYMDIIEAGRTYDACFANGTYFNAAVPMGRRTWQFCPTPSPFNRACYYPVVPAWLVVNPDNSGIIGITELDGPWEYDEDEDITTYATEPMYVVVADFEKEDGYPVIAVELSAYTKDLENYTILKTIYGDAVKRDSIPALANFSEVVAETPTIPIIDVPYAWDITAREFLAAQATIKNGMQAKSNDNEACVGHAGDL